MTRATCPFVVTFPTTCGVRLRATRAPLIVTEATAGLGAEPELMVLSDAIDQLERDWSLG